MHTQTLIYTSIHARTHTHTHTFTNTHTHACTHSHTCTLLFSDTRFCNYLKGNEKCTEMITYPGNWDNGLWNDVDCSGQRGYVCQTYKGKLERD